jgi:gamma-tubulin complex component 3
LSIQSDRDCLSSAVLRENLLESMEKEMKLAYKNACKQVRRILIEDCQLIEQVRCIKQYVLLCKGDFSMNLLELLWNGLNRPAGSLFRHNLVGVLESSIEFTRDPREPDWLLANLDVRLLSNDQISGSSATGWDVFALDYRVSFPVDCILDPQSMQEYSKLSRYIWGLKRLEAVLSRCWQNLRDCQISVSKVVKKELRADLRKMELLQYEMISFVRQALSVCFETISGEWDVFEDILNKMSEKDESSEGEGVDLDALITAHRDFLNNLKGKLRLWSSQAMRSKMSVISLGILRFENVQNALISILQSQSLAPSLNEMRNAFQSSARHFQTDLDDLLMTLQKESALNNSEDLVSRLDFNEYHRRRNGFDTRKYL